MLAWLLHRTSGLGVLFFLVLHILDIFTLAFGPELFDELLVIYHAWWGRILTVFLLFGLLFHALNGARVIVQDFWTATWPYERLLIRIEVAVFLPIFLWGSYVFLLPIFQH